MSKIYLSVLYVFLSFYWSSANTIKNHDIYATYQENISPRDSIAKLEELSKTSYYNGNLEAFKTYCEERLAMAKQHNLIKEQVSALMNLGIYHQQIDQYQRSLDKYLEAEKLSELLPEKSDLKIFVQVNLGNLYNHLEDHKKVESSMKKAIALSVHHDNPDYINASAYSSLGTAYLSQERYQEALDSFKKSKILSEKLERDDFLLQVTYNIAECYRYLGDYKKAIAISYEVLERIEKTNAPGSEKLIAFANLNLGICFYSSEQVSKSISVLKKSRDTAAKGGFLKIKMEAHQYLAKSYEELDNISLSLKEQKNYTVTREQYLQTLSKAQRLYIEKKSEAKTSTIEQQKQSILFLNKEKSFFIGIGIFLVIVLAFSSILYRIRKKKLVLEAKQLEGDRALLKNENKALKDKLNTQATLLKEKHRASNITGTTPKNKKPHISAKEEEKLIALILEYMEQKEPYLNHEIKQASIAKDLGISVHLFSEILNISFQKNFNNFINLYRVDRAKQLIRNPTYTNYKILAIGYESGFPSKTSFNRVFKNLVGLTPTEFRKQ